MPVALAVSVAWHWHRNSGSYTTTTTTTTTPAGARPAAWRLAGAAGLGCRGLHAELREAEVLAGAAGGPQEERLGSAGSAWRDARAAAQRRRDSHELILIDGWLRCGREGCRARVRPRESSRLEFCFGVGAQRPAG